MSVLNNSKIKVVIVVIITTAIAIGIGLLMSKLLHPPPKECTGKTHLDENTNKCVPNCKDGYKNDTLTGECVIDCPDGEVSSKSISGVSVPGGERCVVQCGSGYCDPETDKTLCQDNSCYIPNCKTTDDNPSYCTPPLICGTDTNGKKKTTLPQGVKLDKHGCYEYNSPISPKAPVCPSATPNLVAGTGAYSHEHICCKTSEFAKYTTDGEPFCCPDEDDVIINRKCCPKDKQCTFNGITTCLSKDQACTKEGPCKAEYAIGTEGNYTGCCPFPTSNGECYNICEHVGSSDTGMQETCATDADCDFKSGFKFPDNIPTAGGKCDTKTKTCKLYCGAADSDTQGHISCLNNPNNNTSTCINTTNMCKFTQNDYNPNQYNSNYICDDNSVNPPKSYWRSSSGAPIVTISSTMENPENCNELSCLERMISDGLLGATGGITTGGKQRTLPKLSGSSTPSIKDSTCTATVECNKMKVSQDGNPVYWSKTSDKYVNNNIPVIMDTIKPNVYTGSYHGTGACNVSKTPSECKLLPNGVYSPHGTYDGVTLPNNTLSKNGCSIASWGNKNTTYPPGILCSVNTSNVTSGGTEITPNYYCTSWNACCGEGGLINSKDYKQPCVNLANATCNNGICNYNVTQGENGGIITDGAVTNAAGWPPSSEISNASYLSLKNTMTSNPRQIYMGDKNNMNITFSNAIVIMTYNGKYIGFNSDQYLGTVNSDNPINFNYTYYEGSNLKPFGQIPLVKGYFRFGGGFTSIYNLGLPVRILYSGNWNCKRDSTWNANNMFDTGMILTVVKVSGKWYLAGVKCFYWRSGSTYGLQQGTGKLYYGKYNPSTGLFDFNNNTDISQATPIDINYVFSAVPLETNNADDKFLNGTTVDTIIKQSKATSNYELTFSGLVSKIKSSVNIT